MYTMRLDDKTRKDLEMIRDAHQTDGLAGAIRYAARRICEHEGLIKGADA